MYIHEGRVRDDHPQIQTILDEIGFQSRIGLVAVLVIIACIVRGYGG